MPWHNCRPSQRIWRRGSETKGCFAGGLILTAIMCRQASQGREKVKNEVANSLDEHEFLSNELIQEESLGNLSTSNEKSTGDIWLWRSFSLTLFLKGW